MKTPKDIDEVTDGLAEMFAIVFNDPRRAAQASEVINAAGKLIAAMKVKMCYASLRGEEPDIPFMGKTSGRPLKPGVKALMPS